MLENLMHYCSIMQDIQSKGKVHLAALNEMLCTCAFQSEVQSGEYRQVEKE